eukprot:TRINITY_DN4633_c0_g1_i3.p1 TRINITY_DN4633_c0_g1~~TRINITY_DN4633_c0_g1_i3.p1  ORF type:complete len:205 (+),score=42.68 TRINITY_DN4633_c0_g1_i3:44-658(+)
MGRKKIKIEKIENDRKRASTFKKRKWGLTKKAMELSILCDCEIAMIIFSQQDEMFLYSSSDIEEIVSRYVSYDEPYEVPQTNDEYHKCYENQATPRKGEKLEVVQPPRKRKIVEIDSPVSNDKKRKRIYPENNNNNIPPQNMNEPMPIPMNDYQRNAFRPYRTNNNEDVKPADFPHSFKKVPEQKIPKDEHLSIVIPQNSRVCN